MASQNQAMSITVHQHSNLRRYISTRIGSTAVALGHSVVLSETRLLWSDRGIYSSTTVVLASARLVLVL